MQRFVQLALDLFGDPAPEPPREPQRALTPAAPALPLTEVFRPATWHHPRANRLVRLRGCEVGYEFQRGKRRTIGLSVGAEGLSVRAPRLINNTHAVVQDPILLGLSAAFSRHWEHMARVLAPALVVCLSLRGVPRVAAVSASMPTAFGAQDTSLPSTSVARQSRS